MYKISISGNFLLALKRISLGDSSILENNHFYTRIPRNKVNIDQLNNDNEKWINEILQGENISPSNYITVGPHKRLCTTFYLIKMQIFQALLNACGFWG